MILTKLGLPDFEPNSFHSRNPARHCDDVLRLEIQSTNRKFPAKQKNKKKFIQKLKKHSKKKPKQFIQKLKKQKTIQTKVKKAS
jgi:hypothetical protein